MDIRLGCSVDPTPACTLILVISVVFNQINGMMVRNLSTKPPPALFLITYNLAYVCVRAHVLVPAFLFCLPSFLGPDR